MRGSPSLLSERGRPTCSASLAAVLVHSSMRFLPLRMLTVTPHTSSPSSNCSPMQPSTFREGAARGRRGGCWQPSHGVSVSGRCKLKQYVAPCAGCHEDAVQHCGGRAYAARRGRTPARGSSRRRPTHQVEPPGVEQLPWVRCPRQRGRPAAAVRVLGVLPLGLDPVLEQVVCGAGLQLARRLDVVVQAKEGSIGQAGRSGAQEAAAADAHTAPPGLPSRPSGLRRALSPPEVLHSVERVHRPQALSEFAHALLLRGVVEP